MENLLTREAVNKLIVALVIAEVDNLGNFEFDGNAGPETAKGISDILQTPKNAEQINAVIQVLKEICPTEIAESLQSSGVVDDDVRRALLWVHSHCKLA